MNYFRIIVCFVFVLCIPFRQALACTPQIQGHFLSIVLDTPQLSDVTNKNIGDVIFVKRATLASLSHNIEDLICTNSQGNIHLAGRVSGAETGANTYATSIPGIGLRVSYLLKSRSYSSEKKMLPGIESFHIGSNELLSSKNIILKIELIKTATVPSVNSATYTQQHLLTLSDDKFGQLTQVSLSLQITLPPPHCELYIPESVYNLGEISITQLKTAEKYQGTPIDISVTCTSAVRYMSVTMNGIILSASKGILGLDQDTNSAEGIGVQILQKSKPITLGLPMIFTTNFSDAGTAHLAFNARYIMTSKQLKPGNVHSILSLKLDYL
ncbi:fimbrial protein [Hafnia paralvei]|uniref:fimbrial protein n=1 Tax=Hafnia paralvei TaxID=546367 RepID=UPI003CF5009D